MGRGVEEQLAVSAGLVEERLGLGDQVHQPRPIDHLAGFRSRKAARAAAAELVAAGYRIDGLYRRRLTVWLEFSAMTAVDSATAAAFTREVVGIVNRHGGTYDGWGGYLVGDDEDDVRGRPLTTTERGVIEALLAHDFPGVEELRAQAGAVTASPGCTCGCGTVDLHVPDGLPTSIATNPVPVEATVVDRGGDPVGGLLLFVEHGRLARLEVYDFGDEPLPVPAPEQVRWSRA